MEKIKKYNNLLFLFLYFLKPILADDFDDFELKFTKIYHNKAEKNYR